MKWLMGFCAAPFGALALWSLWCWIQFGHPAPWPEGSAIFLFILMGLVMALFFSGSYLLQRIAVAMVAGSATMLLLASWFQRFFAERPALIGISIFLMLVYWYAFHIPEEGSYTVANEKEAEMRSTIQSLSVVMMPLMCCALLFTLPVFLMNVGNLSTPILTWGMLNLTGWLDDLFSGWEKNHHVPRELIGSLLTTGFMMAALSRERLILAAENAPAPKQKQAEEAKPAGTRRRSRSEWRG